MSTFNPQSKKEAIEAARLFFFAALVFVFVVGWYVAIVSLRDPDTCWLLAIGRYIYEHRALPLTDPFSSNIVGRPVLYQWLAEVIFFAAYKVCGLTGLVVLTALSVGTAFLILPVRQFFIDGLPCFRSMLLAIAALVAASARFFARPEIFSYLLFSVFLGVLWSIRRNSENPQCSFKRADWRPCAFLSILMVLWCNLHAGFIAGLLLLALCSTLSFFDWVILANKGARRLCLFTSGAFFLSIVSTLCNPYAFGLWGQLNRLFFNLINSRIDELRPLGLSDLNDPICWMFVLFCIASCLLCANHIWKSVPKFIPKPHLTLMLGSLAVAIWCGFSCRRMIAFSVLILLFESAHAWRANKSAAPANALHAVFEEKLREIMLAKKFMWPLTAAGCLTAGACIMACTGLSFPKYSPTFLPPFGAIGYLATHRVPGNLLSEPEFADIMIWYLRPDRSIFMDTRFDLYPPQLVKDYLQMQCCSGNWQALLGKYQIRTVFFPPSYPLVQNLGKNPSWSKLYVDDRAAILSCDRTPANF